jgi:hypothetical protein
LAASATLAGMSSLPQAVQFPVVVFAIWINPQQRDAIDDLQEVSST